MEIPCATLQQPSTSSQFHSLQRATGKIRNIFDRAYSTIMSSSSRQMSSKPSLPAVVVNPFAYRRSDSNTTTSSASIPERMVKSIPFLVVCSFLLLSSTAATVRGGSSFTRSTTAQILLPWGRGVRGDNKGGDGISTDMDMDRVVAKLARENQKLEQEMRDLQEALLQEKMQQEKAHQEATQEEQKQPLLRGSQQQQEQRQRQQSRSDDDEWDHSIERMVTLCNHSGQNIRVFWISQDASQIPMTDPDHPVISQDECRSFHARPSHQFRVVSAETERLHVAALEFTVWEDTQLGIDLEQLVTVSSDWTLDTQ